MTTFFPYLALAAPLTIFTSLSSNIVNTNSSYQIEFTTATSGTIKTVDIGFPDHYNTQFAKLIETACIGPGSLSVNLGTSPYNSTIRYTVTSPTTITNDTYIKLKKNQKDWKVAQWFILWTKFEGGKIGSTE